MSRTHHGTASVFVSDAHDTEFNLEVRYSATAGSPAHWCRSSGSWDPPESPELELSDVRCTSVTYHEPGRPPIVETPQNQERLGAWCLAVDGWEDEIREKVLEVASEAAIR